MQGLPWYIQREIISYVVKVRPDLCLLNRSWFSYLAGQFLVIDETKLRIGYNLPDWVKVAERLQLKQFVGLNFDSLKECHHIKEVDIDLTRAPASFLVILEKILSIPTVDSLFLSFGTNKLWDDTLPLLWDIKDKLKVLCVQQTNFDEPFEVFPHFDFPNLIKFEAKNLNSCFDFTRVYRRMPKLESLSLRLNNIKFNEPSSRFSFLDNSSDIEHEEDSEDDYHPPIPNYVGHYSLEKKEEFYQLRLNNPGSYRSRLNKIDVYESLGQKPTFINLKTLDIHISKTNKTKHLVKKGLLSFYFPVLETCKIFDMSHDTYYYNFSHCMPKLKTLQLEVPYSDAFAKKFPYHPMPNLETLQFSENCAIDLIELRLSNLPKLHQLKLRGSYSFYGKLENNISNLTTLDIFTNSENDTLPYYFIDKFLPKLTTLTINCFITHHLPYDILKICNRITNLTINHVSQEKISPNSLPLGPFKTTHLKFIGVVPIRKTLINWLATQFQLTHLTLEDCTNEFHLDPLKFPTLKHLFKITPSDKSKLTKPYYR